MLNIFISFARLCGVSNRNRWVFIAIMEQNCFKTSRRAVNEKPPLRWNMLYSDCSKEIIYIFAAAKIAINSFLYAVLLQSSPSKFHSPSLEARSSAPDLVKPRSRIKSSSSVLFGK